MTLATGCPLRVKGSPASPAEAFVEMLKTAQKGDQAEFEKYFSRSYHQLIETTNQQLAEKKPELRGAFGFDRTLSAFRGLPPVPMYEKIKVGGGEAFLITKESSGEPGSHHLIVEDGRWKLLPTKAFREQIAHFLSRLDAPAPSSQPASQPANSDPHGAVPTEPPPERRAFEDALARADAALRKRDPVGAQKALEEARGIFDDDVRIKLHSARVLVQQGQSAEAVKAFEALKKEQPNFMPAWHYGGMAHLMNNDPKSAAESWAHIQMKNPEYFITNGLAGRLEKAREMAGIKVAPPPAGNEAKQGGQAPGQKAPPSAQGGEGQGW